MTAADLLTALNTLYNELDVTSGGPDESRALSALDMAQDYAEDIIAAQAGVLQTASTVTTTVSTETTALPSTLRRADALFLMDTSVSPSRQRWELEWLNDVGGHAPGLPWPADFLEGTYLGTGAPRGYATDSANFYWRPLPDGTHTVRVWGYFAKTDLTSRAVTFGLPDSFRLPLCSFAARLLRAGVDDPTDEFTALAEATFLPVIRRLRTPVRARPQGRVYTRVHTT